MTTQTNASTQQTGNAQPNAAQNTTAQTSTAAGNTSQKKPAATHSLGTSEGHDGRGRTTVADGVVAKIAGIAIQEIEGVHALGGRCPGHRKPARAGGPEGPHPGRER